MEPVRDNRTAWQLALLVRFARTLRNLSALVMLALSIAVLALGMRSYSRYDALRIQPHDAPARPSWSLESFFGHVHLTKAHFLRKLPPHRVWEQQWPLPTFSSHSADVALYSVHSTVRSFRFGFGSQSLGNNFSVAIPHGFAAVVTAALAFAIKPKPRLRFSLSDLLLLITASAALLAGVAGLDRFTP